MASGGFVASLGPSQWQVALMSWLAPHLKLNCGSRSQLLNPRYYGVQRTTLSDHKDTGVLIHRSSGARGLSDAC